MHMLIISPVVSENCFGKHLANSSIYILFKFCALYTCIDIHVFNPQDLTEGDAAVNSSCKLKK